MSSPRCLRLRWGSLAWLVPACLASGGPQTYWTATVGQFEWRLGRPGVSVLGTPITFEYWFARGLNLIGSVGQAFAPMHLTADHIARRAAMSLLIIAFYVVFAWRSPSKDVARPYILASSIYLVMLFILLPVRHLRYFLPLSLIVGWAVSGYLTMFVEPVLRAVALAALLAVTVLPSFFLVGQLTRTSAACLITRLGQIEPAGGYPLFGPAPPPRILLLARRRRESRAEGRGGLRPAAGSLEGRARCALHQTRALRASVAERSPLSSAMREFTQHTRPHHRLCAWQDAPADQG